MSLLLLQLASQRIQEKITDLERQIAQGKASSYERYKELCGKVAGLNTALDIQRELVKRNGEKEDD